MDKIEKIAGTHTLLYCIVAGVLFLLVLTGVGWIVETVYPQGDYYVQFLIQEALGTVFAYGMLGVSGLLPVLRNRGCGFGRGLLTGAYILVISAFSLVVMPLAYTGEKTLRPIPLLAAYLGCMLCVGMAEEFIFRGVIATLLLKKFGTDSKGIWKAVVMAGILFGLVHLGNAVAGSVQGALVQAAVTSVMGMALAAMYFRSGCIWVTVFLHALLDVAAGITIGLYGNETLADTIASYSPVNLLGALPYLIVLLVLLRKKKIGQVRENMGQLMESDGRRDGEGF